MITVGATEEVQLFTSPTVANAIRYKEPDIRCIPTMFDVEGRVDVLVDFLDTDNNSMGQRQFTFTVAEINAFTASGSTETEKYFNLIEQAVLDELSSIPENSSVTFTIE